MKHKGIIIASILVVVVAIGALIYACITTHIQKVNEDKHLLEINFTELQEKVNNKESFILLVSQTTCSHCMEYKPTLKKVLTKYDIVAYNIELDKMTDQEKAQMKEIANVTSTPNTLFIEDGEEKSTSNRIKGVASASKIENKLKTMGYIKE